VENLKKEEGKCGNGRQKGKKKSQTSRGDGNTGMPLKPLGVRKRRGKRKEVYLGGMEEDISREGNSGKKRKDTLDLQVMPVRVVRKKRSIKPSGEKQTVGIQQTEYGRQKSWSGLELQGKSNWKYIIEGRLRKGKRR